MTDIVPNYFVFFATYSIVFPIVFGVQNFKKLDILVKSLVIFLMIELGNELFAFYLAHTTGYNGVEYACYFILETCYFSLYFYFLLKIRWLRALILIFIPSFIIMGVMKLSLSAPKTIWYTSITITETTVIVLLSIVYFYQLLKAQVLVHITRDADFWVVTGILVYAVLSFFPFGFWEYLHKYHIAQITHIDSDVIAVSNIIMYLFFTFAFLCPPKPRQLN